MAYWNLKFQSALSIMNNGFKSRSEYGERNQGKGGGEEVVPESEGYKLGPGERGGTAGMWLTSNGTTIIRLNHDDYSSLLMVPDFFDF